MSLAVGAPSSCSKDMGLDENKEVSEKSVSFDVKDDDGAGEGDEGLHKRTMSESSLYGTEEEEEEEEEGKNKLIDLGPQVSLRHQIEKDNVSEFIPKLSFFPLGFLCFFVSYGLLKDLLHVFSLCCCFQDDESLRRWKEQLLGSVDLNSVGETLEPEVKFLSLSILSPGRSDIVLPVPIVANSKGVWFTLKEGSPYKLKFSFSVSNNIVSGLKYTNTVWKTGVKVDSAKEMLGTFSPQSEPYIYETPEDTTPTGMFARGSYTAKTKFVDDDGKCYLEINYTFDIRKDWASTTS